MKQKIQHQITPHPLWETIKVEKFHYITNYISKWIEIYSEVAFLFLYAPTLPLRNLQHTIYKKNPLPINPEHTLEHTIYLQVHIKISTVLEFLPYVYKINF